LYNSLNFNKRKKERERMIKVPLSSLLHGAHRKGYEMDNDKLAALTEAYLNQEVEIWPKQKSPKKKKLKSIMESPESNNHNLSTPQKIISRKRQISDTSTPSPKKQKQVQQPKPMAIKVEQPMQSEEPDVFTWTITAEGFRPVNHNTSFAMFNARMAERQRQIEEQEKEDEFHYWAGPNTTVPDIGSLYDYDSSDSILSSSSSSSTEPVVDDMHCHEVLDLTTDDIPVLTL
jgi:hypothetical protein